MAEVSWWQLAGVALGSGLTVKILDIGYQEIRRRSEGRQTAKRFVDEHLDPILKAADELVGKLEALGREGFRPLRMLNEDMRPADNNELGGLIFLFARFWAHVEIIRREGLSIAISQDERGRRLQNFFDCLESRRVRLIDRTAQRAIGETGLEATKPKLQTVSYIEFVRRACDPDTARWLEPLREIIIRGWHTTQRQRLLVYGTVLHAFIDTLDRDHLVTHDRPGISRALTKTSWQHLNYRVFGVYLTFVENRQKYLGLPRREARRGEAARRNF